MSIVAATLLAVGFGTPVHAADVKIGVIYPLTGNAASAGQSAKDAVDLGAEIVNNAHPDLKALPLGAAAGLPNLGGAKIVLDGADHQGNPQVGQQQTLRLITQDHVVAMLGSYHSSVSLVATAVAERQGILIWLPTRWRSTSPAAASNGLSAAGPIAPDFAKAYTEFLTDLKKSGKKIDNIAIVNENTDYGTSVGDSIVRGREGRRTIKVAARIPYNANSSDVSAQVLQLKTFKPDAVIFVSYTSDTILYFKTMKNLDYLPPIIIGDDAGFSDPTFIPNVGDLAQGAVNRSAFDIGKPGSNSYVINRCSRRSITAISTTPARVGCKASSFWPTPSTAPARPSPAKIQAALKATDLNAGSSDDWLSRREVRRDRSKYLCRQLTSFSCRESNMCRLAGKPRHRKARISDEGLASLTTVDGRRLGRAAR